MFRLVIEDDEGHTTPVPLIREEFTIGRREGNSIRLTQRNVSRRHARVFRETNTFFVEDLGSYNGVKLNGERIAGKRSLREGDIVQIGDYHLMIQHERGASSVKAPDTVPVEQARQDPPTTPMRAQLKTNPIGLMADGATPSGASPSSASSGSAPTASLSPTQTLPMTTLPVTLDTGAVAAAHDSSKMPASGAVRFAVLTPALGVRELSIARSGLTIGAEGDLVLTHGTLAKEHARVTFDEGGGVTLHDLGGGVRVNGEAYPERALREGDLVELGGVKLRYAGRAASAVDAAIAPASPAATSAPAKSKPLGDEPKNGARSAAAGAAKLEFDADMAVLDASLGVASAQPDNFEDLAEPEQRKKRGWILFAGFGVAALAVALYFTFVRHPKNETPLPITGLAPKPVPNQKPVAAEPAPRPRARREPPPAMGALPAERPPAALPPPQSETFPPPLPEPRQEPQVAQSPTAPVDEPPSRPAMAPPVAARVEEPSPEPEDPPSPPPTTAREDAPVVMPEVTPPPAIIPPPPPPPAQSSLERAKALVEEGTRILLRAPPQAIGVLLRAIRLAPKYAEAHKQLGIAYNAIGNDAAAARHFRRYLGLRPGASDADEVKRLLDEADRATKGTP